MKNEMTFILLIIWLVDFNIFMYMINMLKNNRIFHNSSQLMGNDTFDKCEMPIFKHACTAI